MTLQLLANRLYTLTNCVLVAAILLKNARAAHLQPWQHRWIDRAVLLVFALLTAGTIWVCASNVMHPRAWDYPSFWVVAKAAASGHGFYDPEELKATFRAANVDGSVPEDWFAEPYYLYLPPSVLLLVPFGWLDFRPSLAVHYAVQAAFLIAAALLLHRVAPVRCGWRGQIEMLVLILAFRPVQAAFNVAQVVFGAFFFAVLALVTLPTRPILAGVALGFGSLYKPLLLIVALAAGAVHRVSASVAFVVVVGGAVAASLLHFGLTPFSDFATHGPSARPAALHLDMVNHSLLTELYRVSGTMPEGHGVLRTVLFPPFVVAAGVLTVATGFLCWLGTRANHAMYLRVGLLLSFALLVYPHTLYNTLPLVLPGLIVAFSFRHRLPAPEWLVVLWVVAIYGAASVQDRGGFVGVLLSWLGIAGLLLALHLRPPDPVAVGARAS